MDKQVYTVTEMQQILNIGREAAYRFVGDAYKELVMLTTCFPKIWSSCGSTFQLLPASLVAVVHNLIRSGS